MKKNLSDYLVAFAVLLGSVVLLGALTYALTGWRHKDGARTLQIDFVDITGIRIQSELRYAGAPAGSVTGVRLLTYQERLEAEGDKKRNAVRVSVRLFEGVPPLPCDVRASLASDTLLSEKFVALSAGTAEAEKLADGALLQGAGAGSIDSLMGKLEPLLASMDTAVSSIDPLVRNATQTMDTLKNGISDLMPRINAVADSAKGTADSAKSAVTSAEAMLKRADKLIADNEAGVKADLDALKASLNQVQGTLKRFDGFVGSTEKQVGGRMQELSVVLQNLKVATTQMKAFTQAIAEKPSRILFSGKPQPLTEEREILRSGKPLPAR